MAAQAAHVGGRVEVRRDGAVATVVLSNPQRRNALDAGMAAELERVLRELEVDDQVRALLLTGSGEHFCAGADLAALEEADVLDRPARFLDWSRTRFTPCLRVLASFPKPVVAAVAGVCVGVGWNMALSCDFCIAGSTARFSQVFVTRGLVPDGGGTWLLPRYVGLLRARELMYTGRFVDADEAVALGLVLRAVSDEDLFAEASALAAELASAPTRAIQFTKALLEQSFGTGLSHAMDQELVYQSVLSQTDDVAEGLASFLEKRPPRFVGD